MHRLFYLLIIALVTGCVTYGTMEKPDAFVKAAVSWEGGNIRDMISIWGRPNNGFTEPSEYMNGMAAWKYDEMEEPNPYAEVKERMSCTGDVVDQYGSVDVDCDTYDANAAARRQYELGRQAGAMFRRRCFVTAEFDETGTILKITAASQNCSPGNEAALEAATRWN